MTISRFSAYLVCWIVCVGASLQAQAAYISGTFSGTASAYALPLGFEPPVPISQFDGAPVSGSFAADIPDPQFQVGGSGYAYYLNGNGGSFAMSFEVGGHSFDYLMTSPSDAPSVVFLDTAASQQSYTLLTSFIPKYEGAWFTLTGPPGSLFDALDPTSLHINAALPPQLSASFRDASLALAIDVDVLSASFQPSTPIPEPPAPALLLTGAAILIGMRAARPRRAVTAPYAI